MIENPKVMNKYLINRLKYSILYKLFMAFILTFSKIKKHLKVNKNE